MKLPGRRALITGAARGIGRALAVAFADAGAALVVTGRDEAAVADTCAAVRARGGTVHPLAWDVADIGVAAARLETARDRLGGLDILINNAGVLRLPADHPQPTPEAEWDYVLTINLKAVFFICKAAGELMKAQRHGVIINIASDAGLRGAAGPYGISKWGVIGLTKGFAAQLAPHGVRVNAIAPGPVATRMMGCPDGEPKPAPSLPLGRFALPDEVAAATVALASDDARAIIGQTIVINTSNT